ncbi:MAG: hypothetical protein KatS3mg027_2371 [Bacteroidia bacterium]|nr:MAG: hypothetical protein KatS3mg027_2371 [Bacteroidia bacterium]
MKRKQNIYYKTTYKKIEHFLPLCLKQIDIENLIDNWNHPVKLVYNKGKKYFHEMYPFYKFNCRMVEYEVEEK